METMTGSISHTVRTTTTDEETSETVVNAVADAKGVDPLDLDPLYDSIDPDALDSIFSAAPGGSSSVTELRFSMDGCEVVVRGAGEVVVSPQARVEESAGRIASHE